MKVPLTWSGLGRLSGLNIRYCRAIEFPERNQINVKYGVYPMLFPVPQEPIWMRSFIQGESVPASADFKIKDFPEQEVEIVVATEFRYHIDDEQERMMANTIFQLWSNKSGHANWQRELREADFEKARRRIR